MFKKQRDDPSKTPSISTNTPRPASLAEGNTSPATIGPSISLKGNISGEEDLVIEGRIEGEIRFQNHNVTVGRKGRVHADVYGKNIRVEGQVNGNLVGQDEVIIRQTGKVEGNLTAPRVTLEDGSSFRGSIDMQSPQARQKDESGARGTTKSPPRPKQAHAIGNTPAR